MAALLVLAISILLLNYWIATRALIEERERGQRLIALFGAVSLALVPALTWTVSQFLMSSPNLEALRAIACVLVIAVLGPLALRVIASRIEFDAATLEVLRRRMLLNCSALAVILLHSPLLTSLGDMLLLGIAIGVGFEFALHAFTQMMARIERAPVPAPFRGMPISLITAGLLALALMGLRGLF